MLLYLLIDFTIKSQNRQKSSYVRKPLNMPLLKTVRTSYITIKTVWILLLRLHILYLLIIIDIYLKTHCEEF